MTDKIFYPVDGKLTKCLFCQSDRFGFIEGKYDLCLWCQSEFCKSYNIRYGLDDLLQIINCIFLDIKYNNDVYHADYIFDIEIKQTYLAVYLPNKKKFYLEPPYELIITPQNYQNKLPTLLYYS